MRNHDADSDEPVTAVHIPLPTHIRTPSHIPTTINTPTPTPIPTPTPTMHVNVCMFHWSKNKYRLLPRPRHVRGFTEVTGSSEASPEVTGSSEASPAPEVSGSSEASVHGFLVEDLLVGEF